MGLPLLMALCALLLPASVQASFHLIKVREVFAGANDNSYVELQMYALGQNLLGGHSLTLYSSSGTLTHTSTFSGTVPNGANQQTVLVGDTGVAGAFGVTPDLVDSDLVVPAAGGAACWNAGGIPADCVAWGNFNGSAALQTATGTSAGSPVSPAGITTGKAIQRLIAPGCPTLLEESDDSNVSSVDFAEVAPAPRNNASTIEEKNCAGAPNTAIDEGPPLRSNSKEAEFTYDAPTATSYECQLDAAAFSSCPPGGPQAYSGLAEVATHSGFAASTLRGPIPPPRATPGSSTRSPRSRRSTSTLPTTVPAPAPSSNTTRPMSPTRPSSARSTAQRRQAAR